MKTVFCFGKGYVASCFENQYGDNYHSILGTSSRPGGERIRYDDREAVQKAIKTSQVILISIPPTLQGCPAYLDYRDLITDNHHIIYLSATSVYGNHDGARVDEKSDCHPQSENGLNRLQAESQWQSHNGPITILRLAGLYGPGRSIFDRLDHIQERIDCPGQKFSRIHVDDICRVIDLVIANKYGGIVNLADDHPAPSRDLIEYACDILGRDYPPLVPLSDANLSAMGKAFYRDQKLVDNAKMKSLLGTSLKYPSYKDGLAAIYAHKKTAD